MSAPPTLPARSLDGGVQSSVMALMAGASAFGSAILRFLHVERPDFLDD